MIMRVSYICILLCWPQSFRILCLTEQHKGTVLKLTVFAVATVFLTRMLHLIQQYTGTVLKLTVFAVATVFLTRMLHLIQ